MKFLYRTFGLATRALSRNAMRSTLTALGTIIGVAAVIAMVEIVKGSTTSVENTIKRMGANRTSLVGSLGPVFTIWLGLWILGEPVHWIQIGGAVLVLAGVTLVSLKPHVETRS